MQVYIFIFFRGVDTYPVQILTLTSIKFFSNSRNSGPTEKNTSCYSLSRLRCVLRVTRTRRYHNLAADGMRITFLAEHVLTRCHFSVLTVPIPDEDGRVMIFLLVLQSSSRSFLFSSSSDPHTSCPWLQQQGQSTLSMAFSTETIA